MKISFSSVRCEFFSAQSDESRFRFNHPVARCICCCPLIGLLAFWRSLSQTRFLSIRRNTRNGSDLQLLVSRIRWFDGNTCCTAAFGCCFVVVFALQLFCPIHSKYFWGYELVWSRTNGLRSSFVRTYPPPFR